MSVKFDDERLIDLVRDNCVLYDASSPKCMDRQLKSKIWEKIGKELQLEPSTCKGRWHNIRDAYRRCLKWQKTRSGQGGSNVNFYKFQKELSFLEPHLAVKSGVCSIPELPRMQSEERILVSPTPEVEFENSETNCLERIVDDKECRSGTSTTSRKRRSTGENESTASKVMAYIQEQQSDPIKQYLMSLYPLLSEMDKHTRLGMQASVYKKLARALQKSLPEEK
ncbi:uncharacterized protein LOC113465147 [Ceratina calcarata]|uniref:Uncharacterized protein LOC113465147 n=1 Tax=Ceratina calcarata TaxID=156304 RepID=A0AAJ7SCC3_9HYME|nr:uncharacterized protein LOC113465147 [Ceratina calcarata]